MLAVNAETYLTYKNFQSAVAIAGWWAASGADVLFTAESFAHKHESFGFVGLVVIAYLGRGAVEATGNLMQASGELAVAESQMPEPDPKLLAIDK